jgi:NADH dehydrogenase FAD-containing subunit
VLIDAAQAEAIRQTLIDNVAKAGIPGVGVNLVPLFTSGPHASQCWTALDSNSWGILQWLCRLLDPAGRSNQEVERLLHVVIVGGGPTGALPATTLMNTMDTALRSTLCCVEDYPGIQQ